MVEALIGLLGVLIGSAITWVKDVWTERQKKKRDAHYLAFRVISVLDQFVDACCDVASDAGQEDDQEYTVSTVDAPDPPEYPGDVDWRSIAPEMMYDILKLPNQVHDAERDVKVVGELFAGPPDYTEWFWERRYQYSSLGLTAHNITMRLRATYGIPGRELEKWDPEEKLTKTRNQLREERRSEAVDDFPG